MIEEYWMWIVSFLHDTTLKNDLENMLVHIDDIFHLLCVFTVFFLFAVLEEVKLAAMYSIFCIFYFFFNKQLL